MSDLDSQITHLLKVAKQLYKNASEASAEVEENTEAAVKSAGTVDAEMRLHQQWERELEEFLKDAKELGLSDKLVQTLRKEALEAHEMAMSKSAALDEDLVKLGKVLDAAEGLLAKVAKREMVGEFEVCPHMAPALHYADFEMEKMDLSDESKLAIRKFEHDLREKHGAVDFDIEDGQHFGRCDITGDKGMVVTVRAFADK